MQLIILPFSIIIATTIRNGQCVSSNPFNECAKLFNPRNYVNEQQLLAMPYIEQMRIPQMPAALIRPTPVRRAASTKVLTLVTKYVYRNPVCVRIGSRKKRLCGPAASDAANKSNMQYLVTKELFVANPRIGGEHNRDQDDENEKLYVQGSEEDEVVIGGRQKRTPKLSSYAIKDMLIEDRLDQLETVLPHYSRMRTYETSTITVTKVRSNNRATATLMVKNCVPQGYELCPRPPPTKNKKRKSKVARFSGGGGSNATTSASERNFYG